MAPLYILKKWKKRDLLLSILKNATVVILIGWMFYGSLIAGLLGLPVVIVLIKLDQVKWEENRKEKLNLAFCEVLQSMKAALRAGYAIENTLQEAKHDLENIYPEGHPMIAELSLMQSELQMSIPIEQVFQNFSDRQDIEDVRDFVVIFRTAKRTGGNLIEIMSNTVDAIEEKIRMKQAILTVLSSKKLEWHIMSLVPFGILLYMRAAFPDFLLSLYGNIIGVMTMSAILLVIGVAYFIGNRMLRSVV